VKRTKGRDWRLDLSKYLRYSLEMRPFKPSFDHPHPSPQALESARQIRGSERGPAIMLHGIMPRSGTVYVGELLRLHPGLHAYPYQLWEFPALQQTRRVFDIETAFLQSYYRNRDKIGQRDFLPLFGSALIGYLHSNTPAAKRVLLKVPSVQHLSSFFEMFPHEHLLVVTRDGRDVVHSTLKTWPALRFWMVCLRWRRSAQMVIACHKAFDQMPDGYGLTRFEDAVAQPEVFVRDACHCFHLDPSLYPYEQIPHLPVRGSSTMPGSQGVSWAPSEKGSAFNPVGRWRRWSKYRKSMFKCIAGRQLIDLGYVEDMNW